MDTLNGGSQFTCEPNRYNYLPVKLVFSCITITCCCWQGAGSGQFSLLESSLMSVFAALWAVAA